MTGTTPTKPWYRSLASWGAIAQLALTIAIAIALWQGVDVEALLQHGLAAAGIAAAIVSALGNITRRQPLDPEQVLPGLRSRAVGRAVDAVTAAKARLLP